MSVKMSERQRPSHPLGGTVAVESEKPTLGILAADTQYSILPTSLKLISDRMVKRHAYNTHCSLRSLWRLIQDSLSSPTSWSLSGEEVVHWETEFDWRNQAGGADSAKDLYCAAWDLKYREVTRICHGICRQRDLCLSTAELIRIGVRILGWLPGQGCA